MDSQRPANPLADVARSRRNPQQIRIEAPPSEVSSASEEARPRRRARPRPVVTVTADAITLREMLASRNGLRRAFLLTEILGPPKALRRDK